MRISRTEFTAWIEISASARTSQATAASSDTIDRHKGGGVRRHPRRAYETGLPDALVRDIDFHDGKAHFSERRFDARHFAFQNST